MKYLEYHAKEWDQIFKDEFNNIHFLLPDMKLKIEHIGATSLSGSYSFRNVDLMIATSSLADIYTAKMMLSVLGYKEMPELGNEQCVVMVKQKKYHKIGVTLRIVEYGSEMYNSFTQFKNLLQTDIHRVNEYNSFRDNLFEEVNKDIKEYNKRKYAFIKKMVETDWNSEQE